MQAHLFVILFGGQKVRPVRRKRKPKPHNSKLVINADQNILHPYFTLSCKINP